MNKVIGFYILLFYHVFILFLFEPSGNWCTKDSLTGVLRSISGSKSLETGALRAF